MSNKYFVWDENLAYHAAEYFCEKICAIAEKKGKVSIAISGGNTPKHMLEILADPSYEFFSKIPWSNIWLFFVDERAVSPEHIDSNYKMVKEAMLDKVVIPSGQVFRMKGELDPAEAASDYQEQLLQYFGCTMPKFDIVQLGMGDDGHTASLFPHTDGLLEETAAVVANFVSQKNTWRITLTKTAINSAESVFFLISGASKAEALRQVLSDKQNPMEFPAQLIRPSGQLDFLMDKDAAAGMNYGS